jgi:hypothetical protein
MECTITVHDCGNIGAADPTIYWQNGTDDCVTVALEYDYAGFPLIIDPPLLSAAMPDTVASTSVTRLNQ